MTAPFSLRPARETDWDAIKDAVRRARLDRTGLDWRNFTVAEDASGEMIGFCQVRRYRGVHELGSLYVRKAFRSQGIGAALIRACLREQAPPIHLECLETRQTYYERFGFHRIALGQAPLALRLKALLGTTATQVAFGKRVIVMRWDG